MKPKELIEMLMEAGFVKVNLSEAARFLGISKTRMSQMTNKDGCSVLRHIEKLQHRISLMEEKNEIQD